MQRRFSFWDACAPKLERGTWCVAILWSRINRQAFKPAEAKQQQVCLPQLRCHTLNEQRTFQRILLGAGVEYNSVSGRCEVWHREVERGFWSFQKGLWLVVVFLLISGGGGGGVGRGGSTRLHTVGARKCFGMNQ